jgi:hypothetical protein
VGGGRRGAKSYDRMKAWPSINPSILSVPTLIIYAIACNFIFYVQYMGFDRMSVAGSTTACAYYRYTISHIHVFIIIVFWL